MRDVVIAEAARTPVGRRNGALKDVHPVVLGAMALRELLQRTKIDPAAIEDVVFGCVSQVGEQSLNIARNVVLQAGFPIGVPAATVDRHWGSGHEAIRSAPSLIASGVCDVTVAGGVESMTRVQMGPGSGGGEGPSPASLLE